MVKVVVYGDSIGEGIAAAGGEGVINRSIRNKGLAANNLMDVATIPRGHPVICSFGWNDTWMVQNNPAAYEERVVNRLLAVAERAQGQPIVLLGLEPIARRDPHISHALVGRTNALLDRALDEAQHRAQQRGIPFHADFVSTTEPPVGHRAPADGLHYTPRGSQLLLAGAMEHIESVARETGRGASAPAARRSLPPLSDGQQLNRAEIRTIQTALRAQGFDPGAIDGLLGPNTMAAWRRYEVATLQTQLTAAGFDTKGIDGIIGRNTQGAIAGYEAARGPLVRHDNGVIEQAEVQALLHAPPRARPPQGRG